MASQSDSPEMIGPMVAEDYPNPQSPLVDHNTTKSPAKPNGSPNSVSPSSSSLGPVIVFIARATDLLDHDYPGATFTTGQMHEYLHSLLVIVSNEHRKVYGELGSRPHKMQTIIHSSNIGIPISARPSKFLAAALEEARDTKSECIFVLYNWDGWTTCSLALEAMCDMFKDVPFTLRVYANGHGVPREFYSADAHKACGVLSQRLDIKDERITSDRDTALFVRMFEALHRVHNPYYGPTIDDMLDLARYDSRKVN
ncbi:unnamed protein product [Penicillium bialowiezense]